MGLGFLIVSISILIAYIKGIIQLRALKYQKPFPVLLNNLSSPPS